MSEQVLRLTNGQGARSISLSLNRTFVLPETPRSIDLQLQGNDLVDICTADTLSLLTLESELTLLLYFSRLDLRTNYIRSRAIDS